MNKDKPTLAIYGIQDREDYPFPFYVHDHNLALMNQGQVEAFLQQERVSRRKRDNTLHIHLKDILKARNLLSADYDLVFVDNVVGRSFITRAGNVRFEAPLADHLSSAPERGKCWWFGRENPAWVVNHELAHIFSCLPFYGNFRENSLLVHFDGGASRSNFSAAHWKNGKFKWLEYHWDLKAMSTLYNANALVFAMLGARMPEQNSVPGKFMGFAGWGSPDQEIENWLLDNNLFQDIWGKTSYFLKKAGEDFGVRLKSFNLNDPFIQNVAATLQEIFVKRITGKLTLLAEATQADFLYYTGGSALNIVANSRIADSRIFREVFIPPCTEDSGLALGAAAFAEYLKQGSVNIHSPYLNNWGLGAGPTVVEPETLAAVARMVAGKKIIGICNGAGEAGPRALGNRSIVALPSKNLARSISIDKKGREWYRPLAPAALLDQVKYFTGLHQVPILSKYMLLDFKVLPERRHEIEGVVHSSGTARFQTIFQRSDNPFLHDLLKVLNEKHGVKAIINTSFNSREEPIVHTFEDALTAARKMNLDALVYNGKLIPLA